VAVDTAGALYVTDAYYGDKRVLKLAAGASAPTVLPFTGLDHPLGVAVDTAGNLYVAERSNRVLKLAAGASAPTPLPSTGLDHPHDVAVDSAGNL
jgi:serine/threonine-protein kinase